MKKYYFFLSYSRTNAAGSGYLRQFFDDLVRDVASAARPNLKPGEDIGFFDTSDIEPGEDWDNALAEALRTCNAFVPLYSRSYFSSPYCGKEYQAFLTRLEKHAESQRIKRPPLIIPVVWDFPNKIPKNLPSIISEIQYSHEQFGAEYAMDGLDMLMRQNRKELYEPFVLRFANKLVEAVEQSPLPPSGTIERLKDVPNAFIVDSKPAPPAQAGPGPEPEPDKLKIENLGPDYAHFVYVAGSSKDFEKMKKFIEAYGEKGGRSWRPYIPGYDKQVGLVATIVSGAEGLQPEALPLTDDLIEKIKLLDENNTIAVLVVDPWTLNIQTYKTYMSEYDKVNVVNCGVLIIWNETDSDLTDEMRSNLNDVINETFMNNRVKPDLCFRDSIRSAQEMEAHLTDVIKKLKERIQQRMKLLKPRPPSDKGGPPGISVH